MPILAIDQGTSATKALVVSDDGELLATAEVPVACVTTADGGVEQEPEALWQSVLAAGREAITRARAPIAAVGLANQGETVLAWDRTTTRPLSRAVSWQDRRAAKVCDRLRPHAEALHRITGLPLDPYFAAPKMKWMRERITAAGVSTTTDAWLLARLAGSYVTDAATASRTALMDLDRTAWSAEACAFFGIDPAMLPQIVGCAEPVGETSVFGPPVPVVGLAVDQQAALFAEGCFARGEAKCTYGTGAFLLTTVGDRPRRSTSGLVGCVAWRLGGETTYCLDAQVYSAGAAVSWLQRLGLIADPTDLDTVGGAVSDTGGVAFVPALAGLAAPFWRPHARAGFVGMTLASERAHLVRAVIEGIAAQIAWLARAVADDLGRPLARLRVDGGLTRSRVLMQTQADLLQTPIEVYPSPHATALGIAALARLGCGMAASAADAVGRWRPSEVYEPAISADEAEARAMVWRAAANATMDLHCAVKPA